MCFILPNYGYLTHACLDKVFNDTVVNLTCPPGECCYLQVSEGLTSPARSSSSQYLIRRGISGDLISPTGSHTSYDTGRIYCHCI